ncbi:MAG: S46 family peptidase [Planctomycetes bacterium]|nr:S46 family peptidase [Planctomycetota bacterium]
MRSTLRQVALLFLPALVGVLPAQEHKELGRMWTFENAPLGWFQEAYDFTPGQDWLDHARLSSLRFGRGCSASFVSPHGLIMTNHHCARGNIAQVQGEEDWLRDGYYSGGFAGEVPLPGLTVQQLIATRDVTAEIKSGADRNELLGQMSAEHPELTHQLVSLYQGGQYQIYSYRSWDDLRLVCAPHGQSAHFGGDPDNFCYPRWGLDFTFVRAYQDGKPADTSAHYFKWKTAGAGEGELVFTVGNPGSTGRLQTVAQCEYLRDHRYPGQVRRAEETLETLARQAAESPEREKQLRTRILSVENSRKANQGYLDGLRNARIMDIKRRAEAELRAAIAADPELQRRYGDAWDIIVDLQAQKVAAAGDREATEQIARQEREQQTRIGEACFAVYGNSIPPDATFTLRLSDGLVKGFPMNGTIAPYFTSLYGLYARHTEFGGVHPFDLPQIWLDREHQLDLSTPFNFVATCDIIGGNSGSPMIDREQNVVGLIFDGNIEMLGNNYVFDDEVSRTVSVHPAIIIEALRKIYDAGALADELEKGTVRRPE